MSNQLFSGYSLPPQKKGGSERADLIKEIYKLYEEDEIGRKKENWKRYIKYLKDYSWPDTKDHQAHFRKTKLFVQPVPIKSFCYLISHISTVDLYPLLSTAKDHKARGFNVSGYIASHFSKGVIR